MIKSIIYGNKLCSTSSGKDFLLFLVDKRLEIENILDSNIDEEAIEAIKKDVIEKIDAFISDYPTSDDVLRDILYHLSNIVFIKTNAGKFNDIWNKHRLVNNKNDSGTEFKNILKEIEELNQNKKKNTKNRLRASKNLDVIYEFAYITSAVLRQKGECSKEIYSYLTKNNIIKKQKRLSDCNIKKMKEFEKLSFLLKKKIFLLVILTLFILYIAVSIYEWNSLKEILHEMVNKL